MIFNKHLLINVGEREYTYRFADEKGEHIMSGLICTAYLPLPSNTKEILKYSVENGIIYEEVGKSF